MLILDNSDKSKKEHGDLYGFLLKGTMDEAPKGEFKEEDHPRGGKGSEKGGQFVKSEKTKQKEDEVDDININAEEVDSELLDRCDKKLSDDEVIRLKKVAASTKDPKLLKKLAFAERYTSSNSNCEIQEAVANNPNTPSDILRHLSGFPRQNEDYKGKMYNNDVASSAKAMLSKKR